MKVRLEVTLDVNAKAWCDEYLCDPSEVREDVKNYFQVEIAESTPGNNGIVRVVKFS